MSPERRRSYGYVGNEDQNDRPAPKKESSRQFRARPILSPSSRRLLQGVGAVGKMIFLLPWKILAGIGATISAIFFRGRPPKVGTVLRFGMKAGMFVAIVGLVAGIGLIAWVSRDLPDPNKLTDRHVAQSTKIYDRTGTHLLYEIFGEEKRTIIPLDQIPQDLINGVIATEDSEFYNHHGIRILSFVRSLGTSILTLERPRGTSTLTQQLVKNAILNNERSYIRKLKEVILSLRLEQKYSKDQILQIYFNEIPYGSTNYGVEAAAQSYFGKSVRELDLQESATLAGIPQRPSVFLRDAEALKNRRDFVLRRMYEEGYITAEQKEAAQAAELTLQQKFKSRIEAPHFVMYVKEQLEEQFGEQTVNTGGLRVITSLDWDKQQLAEKAVEDNAKIFEEASADNIALVAMDPRSGEILSMIGSRDFFNPDINGQYNVAVQGRRQPGSSFKPIIYAAAFEKGYTPDTVLFDVSTNFCPDCAKEYRPVNYTGLEYGLVTIRQALQGSLNIPAVKTLYLVGLEDGVRFAERLGYTTLSRGAFGLSLVLGGGEVHLLEHTAAYATFANNGLRMKPVSIMRVEDPTGEIVFEQKKQAGERVLDPKITATLSNVLSDDEARAYIFGRNSSLTLKDRPVAAKTGTTNQYVDAWTMGYTPSLVTGVWVGNTDNTPMKAGAGGNRMAGVVWRAFMEEALAGTPVETFPEPSPNDAEKPVLRGSIGGITLQINSLTGNIAASSTPPEYITTRTYIPPHDILHYVIKDNPRGPTPTNPADDPQYLAWEEAIQQWIARNREKNPAWSISFEEPPTEYDTEPSLELMPSLTVSSPSPSSTLSSRDLMVTVVASAPRGVARVIYRLDGRPLATINTPPFDLSTYLAGIQDGDHLLTVIAEDDERNRRIVTIPFTLAAGAESPYVSWLESSQSLSGADFPRTFLIRPYATDQIQQVILYRQQPDGGNRSQIGTISDFSNLFEGHVSFVWDEFPGSGEWDLVTEVQSTSGQIRPGGRLRVTIR